MVFDVTQSLDDVIELLRSNYGEIQISNRDYLNWEYLKNPNGLPVMVVALSEIGEIVGQYVVIPVKYVFKGKIILGSLSLNTLTRADYRGKGLFTLMAGKTFEECARKKIHITIGFPNPDSFQGFVKKLNFQHVGNTSVLFSPLNPVKILMKKLFKFREIKYGEELPIRDERNKICFEKNGYVISEFNLDDDHNAYRLFLNEFKLLHTFMTYRDIPYLRWRYLEIPKRKYRMIKVTKNKRFLGYCVLRGRRVFGLNSGFITDICSLNDKDAKDGMNTLIAFIKKLFLKNNMDIAGCLVLEHSNEYKLLKEKMFFKLPKRFLPHDGPVICRMNSPIKELQELTDFTSWFLTFGDYDVM